MTRRWPWLIVTVLCCVLTLTTSALAECAWVLWYKQTGMRLPDVVGDPPSWEVVQAKASRAECLRGLTAEVAREERATNRNREISVTEDMVSENLFRVADDGHRELVVMRIRRYVCLPDTVDPRGPKEK